MFAIIHIYMTTTGTTPISNLKAMITGYEELEEPGNIETTKTTDHE
jgi:hypothetical protein